MKFSADDIVQKSSGIYSLPTIYVKLDREINDPLSNLEDLAKILLDDAGLSARLLRIANSAMYSFPSTIDTVTRAITIIGTNQLRDLALATSVITLFKGIDESVINMEDFWKHSIAVGIAARVIATYRAEPNVERFYLMGLLHDIGRILMYIQIPELLSDLIEQCKENNSPLYKLEKQILGFEHGTVGSLLLREWGLPVAIIAAVENHHKPTVSGMHMVDSSIIHIADLLANSMQLGTSGISIVPPLNEKAWESIGLPSALVPDMIEHLESQYRDAVEVFLS